MSNGGAATRRSLGRTPADGGVGRGVLAMRVAAVVLAAGALVCGALWFQLDRTLAAGGRLEDRANASAAEVSAKIEGFRGDPESGAALLPKLKRGRVAVKAIRADSNRIGASFVPIAEPACDDYRRALASYATHTDEYYATLTDLATFVVDRAEVVKQLSSGLQVLSKLSKSGAPASDVKPVIEEAKAAVDKSAEQLRSLSATVAGDASLYSNDALLDRLTALSGFLGDVTKGIDTRDSGRIKAAAQGFGALMKADWQTLFFSADEEGLKHFGEALSDLVQDRQDISVARQSIAEWRTSLAAAAIALAVIALLAAAVAWLR